MSLECALRNYILLANEGATEELGARFAVITGGLIIALRGTLGAGKTTLVRGFLRARGYFGSVKSPTFTLIEPYELPGGAIYHFDLYRLTDPEELELIGVRDYLFSEAICLVEWPERAAGTLNFDLAVALDYHPLGRAATISVLSPRGQDFWTKIACQALPHSWPQAPT